MCGKEGKCLGNDRFYQCSGLMGKLRDANVQETEESKIDVFSASLFTASITAPIFSISIQIRRNLFRTHN